METNSQHYRTQAALWAAKRKVCITECAKCRFSFQNWPRDDPNWGEQCIVRFGASPFGAPADIREPWPPPADPNPL